MWRRQLPVYSPLSLAAVAAGGRGLFDRAPATGALRGMIEERWQPRAILLVDSGTSALRLALEGSARRSPPVVALPAFGCYDLATAAVGAGCRVVLYDIHPETLTPALASLSAAFAASVSAVVVASWYGQPAGTRAALRMAESHEALVIEDAAQAGGLREIGRPAGSTGSLGVLSFGRGKGLTGGRAGALLANEPNGEAALERVGGRPMPAAPVWSTFLALTAQWALARPQLYRLPAALPWLRLGETVYRQPHSPRAPSAVACRVLEHTFALADQELMIRRRNAARLLDALAGHPRLSPVTSGEGEPGYLRLPVLAAPDLLESMDWQSARALGVARSYPRPLSSLSPLRPALIDTAARFPGAERLAHQLITLPTHSRLTGVDMDRLIAWIRRSY